MGLYGYDDGARCDDYDQSTYTSVTIGISGGVHWALVEEKVGSRVRAYWLTSLDELDHNRAAQEPFKRGVFDDLYLWAQTHQKGAPRFKRTRSRRVYVTLSMAFHTWFRVSFS